MDCEQYVCLHGGTCEMQNYQFGPHCICPPKFIGEFCEKLMNKSSELSNINLTPDSRQGKISTTPEVSSLFLATLGLTFLVVLLLILGIIKFGRKRVHVTQIFQPPTLSKIPPGLLFVIYISICCKSCYFSRVVLLQEEKNMDASCFQRQSSEEEI